MQFFPTQRDRHFQCLSVASFHDQVSRDRICHGPRETKLKRNLPALFRHEVEVDIAVESHMGRVAVGPFP